MTSAIWRVISSHHFLSGTLLVLAIGNAIKGEWMLAGVEAFFCLANFAFAAAAEARK